MIELGSAALVALVCVPTLVACLLSWRIQRRQERQEAAREKREDARKKNEELLMDCVCASMALGEATAKAVQADNPNCNGEMSCALEYTRKVKHQHREFLRRQGIENLH